MARDSVIMGIKNRKETSHSRKTPLMAAGISSRPERFRNCESTGEQMDATMRSTESTGRTLESIGEIVIRYGLVVMLLWVGLLKFTAYEVEGIEPLVANSPLMSWALQAFGLRTLSNLLGIVEIGLGLLIAVRPFAPGVSAIGSLGAIGMFLITLTFVLTTPGVWQPSYGFPFPSPMPGQFLLKDLVLLGAAIWTAGEAMQAGTVRRARS